MRWFAGAAWRAQRGRWITAAAAVAVGIALATAIFTVNRSALAEFQQAIDTINGEASLQITGRAGFFDDRVFDAVAARAPAAGIEAASPVLAVEVMLPQVAVATGRPRERLLVLGLDVFRAGAATPALLPQADAAVADAGGAGSSLFSDDAVFLSPAAQAAYGVRPGGTLIVANGLVQTTLRVAGSVAAQPGQRLAVMDIGAAQWHLGAIGKLSRIDLKLAEGASLASVSAGLAKDLPANTEISAPDKRTQRMSNLSRAYRVNLNVLALVALFTGAFIVFSAVGLSAMRQRPQLALMSVLGADDAWVRHVVLLQGVAVAGAGSLAGVAAGLALAAGLLGAFGGDLGGGYFSGVRPQLVIDLPALALFATLGVAVGVVASWLPAREAVAARPVEALRGGSAEVALSRLARLGPALWLLAIAIVLLMLPPVGGLPVPAYLAIACVLLAAIAAVPWLVAQVFPFLHRHLSRHGMGQPVWWLALTRVAQAPGQAAGVIAGVVASFALTVAMVIMVASFRLAVADWLQAVLPADLYGRVPAGAAQGAISPDLQARIARAPGVTGAEFSRALELSLDPARPTVALLARSIDPAAPQQRLPLTGPALPAPPGTVPLYVSEGMVDLYAFTPGKTVLLPVGPQKFHISGVYRDYARQHGSITLARADYTRITGDASVNDMALWLDAATAPEAAIAALVGTEPTLAAAEFRSARELRALSLRIFDRSFAMTYLLEAAALVVALFGVASSYAAQALARAREFGVLRHLGVSTREIVLQVAIEGGLLSAFGALWGAAIGWVIGIILIRWVNPQSFHWTMEITIPFGLLSASALALALCGAIAAALAVRSATGEGPLRSLKEDW
jgi:putative ABC transport system permease protein